MLPSRKALLTSPVTAGLAGSSALQVPGHSPAGRRGREGTPTHQRPVGRWHAALLVLSLAAARLCVCPSLHTGPEKCHLHSQRGVPSSASWGWEREEGLPLCGSQPLAVCRLEGSVPEGARAVKVLCVWRVCALLCKLTACATPRAGPEHTADAGC